MKKIIICSILLFGNVYSFWDGLESQIQAVGVNLLKATAYPLVLFVQASVLNHMDNRFDWNASDDERDRMIRTMCQSSVPFTAAIVGHDNLTTEAQWALGLLGASLNLHTLVQIKKARRKVELERKKDALKK